MNTNAQTDSILAVAIVKGGETFSWDEQAGTYASEDGDVIDTANPDISAALRRAQARAARRLMEAQLEDGESLAHFPQPRDIRDLRVITAQTANLMTGMLIGSLVAEARAAGSWDPVSIDTLADSACSSPASAGRWQALYELSSQLQELADLDLVVLWDGNIHFTQALVRRLPIEKKAAARAA